uniref:Env polyprotein n=1 Tax=Avian leukosis virus TaxID=11864 RepID=K9NTC3_ALV|nr:envelope protein [Avian leukosis virus]
MEAVIKAFLTGHPGKVSKKDSKKKPPATSKKDPEKTPLLPSRGCFSFQMILVCVVIISAVPGVGGVHLLPQPGNVWVTWANKTGQTDFCLSLQSATSPFRTCLIGIPQYPLDTFKGYVTNVTACQNDTDLASQTACLIQALNTTLPWDPQELDILGSQMIKNGTTRTCVTFGSVCYKENNRSRVCHIFDGNFNGTGGAEAELRDFIAKWKNDDRLIRPYVNQSWTMVSPINTESFSISSRYCGFTSNETRYYGGNVSNWCGSKGGEWSAGYSNGTECSNGTADCGGNCTAEWNYYAYGFTFGKQPEVLWNNGTAKALPPGIFLICGDRAWQGIPRNAVGGPCYLGQLTMLSPNFTTWITYGPNITGHRRSRRSVHHLSDDCSDEVQLWSATARIFASIFAPGVAAAQALREIERLACWSVKQANLTSLVLNAMLEDMNSVRHAVLQNRAAIDFLLLAQGHGCQDVEGMCCFNLSDHSESIHKTLQAMREHVNKIGVDSDPIGSWLRGLFGGIGEWAVHLLKGLLLGLVVILLLIVCLPCLLQLVSSSIRKMINNSISYHTEYKKLQRACGQPESRIV